MAAFAPCFPSGWGWGFSSVQGGETFRPAGYLTKPCANQHSGHTVNSARVRLPEQAPAVRVGRGAPGAPGSLPSILTLPRGDCRGAQREAFPCGSIDSQHRYSAFSPGSIPDAPRFLWRRRPRGHPQLASVTPCQSGSGNSIPQSGLSRAG